MLLQKLITHLPNYTVIVTCLQNSSESFWSYSWNWGRCFVKVVYTICEHKVGFCWDCRMEFPSLLYCRVQNEHTVRVSLPWTYNLLSGCYLAICHAYRWYKVLWTIALRDNKQRKDIYCTAAIIDWNDARKLSVIYTSKGTCIKTVFLNARISWICSMARNFFNEWFC